MMTLKNKLIHTLRLYYQFISRYGLWNGTSLFFSFRRKKTDQLKVPGITQPLRLRKESSDFKVFYQVFLHNDGYLQKVIDPKVIIDAGANIGLNTVKFKNQFPGAKIIAIEPDPDNFLVLIKNIEGYKEIYPEQCGLWNKDVNLRVVDKFGMGSWSLAVEEDPAGPVKAVTVRSIMEKYEINQVDLLKIDIETSEKYVFSENFVSWLPFVKVIAVELHDHMLDGCSMAFFKAINAAFSDYEYSHSGEYTIIVNRALASNS